MRLERHSAIDMPSLRDYVKRRVATRVQSVTRFTSRYGFDILRRRRRAAQADIRHKVTSFVTPRRRPATGRVKMAVMPGGNDRSARPRSVILFDPELFDPIPQRAEADPEELRGGGLVIARLLERFDDRVAFDLLELRAERSAVGVDAGRNGAAASGRGLVRPLSQLDVVDVDFIAGA